MIKMAVKTEMRMMTRKNECRWIGMCQFHATTMKPVKFKGDTSKWHAMMMTLLLLYTHDSKGDGPVHFCPLQIPELKKDESER
jgi:hypothetical protein